MYEIAIPAICMSSIMSIATVFINKILSAYSSSATTAFGVYFKLYQFSSMVFLMRLSPSSALIMVLD